MNFQLLNPKVQMNFNFRNQNHVNVFCSQAPSNVILDNLNSSSSFHHKGCAVTICAIGNCIFSPSLFLACVVSLICAFSFYFLDDELMKQQTFNISRLLSAVTNELTSHLNGMG